MNNKTTRKKGQPTESKNELTAVKGVKQIPFKIHPHNEKVTTGNIIQTILTYNPKMVDPESEDAQRWGLTISEMLDRKAIRKEVENSSKETKYYSFTDSQAKHLADMCAIIKWNGEDDFIMDFWESLK